MPSIPPLALERLARLRGMAAIARAGVDGFATPIEYALREVMNQQTGLTSASRGQGTVRVDEQGRAYRESVREITRNNPSGAVMVERQSRREPMPQFDAHALELHRAKQRLGELRAQQAEAGAKAAGLMRAVEDCERALRERGWREGRA
jgi:hypothetical protein